MGHNEVDQQTAGIKTSSPLFNFFFLNGFISEETASKFADEPELVINAYFKFNFSQLLSRVVKPKNIDHGLDGW